MYGMSDAKLLYLKSRYIGKEIEIINMEEEPSYSGKKGTCVCVDDVGTLHGTWGGCGLIPGVDSFRTIK